MPADRPVISTETVTEFGFPCPVEEPEVGLIVNQDCVFVAVQLSVPTPEFQTERVPGVGLDPPAVALKGNDEALMPIPGVVAPATVSVTGTVRGELEAPEAVMVILSL